MNKIYIVVCTLMGTALFCLIGCTAEPITTTAITTITAPAQTVTKTSTIIVTPQKITTTTTKIVTETVSATITGTPAASIVTSPTTSSSATELRTEITGVEVEIQYEGTVQSHVGVNEYNVYSTATSIIVEANITSFQRYTINIFGEFYDAADSLLGTSSEMTIMLPGMPGYGVAEIEYITEDTATVKKCIIVISEG